ncbi:hypothetical protein MNBD_ALPHA11-2429 [hydrothermal vent metagenome]|uniref:DUF1697 domain-containing protein n=1 Tax=hydrothermal vent metagenome TaxID=652676 RepID=A0A3B0U667_9ZZZZ
MQQKYVAFLRGINLGKRNIKMDDLRQVFTELKFSDAQTVIASGNVIFSASVEPDAKELQAALKQKFGFEVGVVIRSIKHLQSLIDLQPFAKYPDSKDTKLYVTFSSQDIGSALSSVSSIPGDFDLVKIENQEFFCAAFRQENGRFGAGMDGLEKLFKHQVITTRNWNTVKRILVKANG